MSETTTTTDAAAETSGDSTEATEATATETTETTQGEAALGDAGKKALEAMKAERKAARDEAAAVKAELAALKAKVDGKEAEFAAQQEAQRITDAALSAANRRILKSEVKAAAKGVLADAQDAYKFLDLDSFEVDSDGNVDESAIAAALDALVASKPYLAAQGKRFQGTADGGARNDATSQPTQLTQADMARMSAEQIAAAEEAGQFNDLLGRK